MAEIIEMPKLSDTMTVGTLVKWLIEEGETVASGDVICEVETDKATMEVENFFDGVLLKQYVAEGEEIPVGDPMCAVGEVGEKLPETDQKTVFKEESKPDTKPEKVVEEPSSKTIQESSSKPVSVPTNTTPPVEAMPSKEVSASDSRIKSSPLARKIAAEKGVDLASIKGSGPGGRIVKVDVEKAAIPAKKPVSVESSPKPSTSPSIVQDATVKVSNMRKAIARRLLESKTTIPHFYLNTEVNAAPLIALRQQLNGHFKDLPPEQGGIKFTVNDFILKASAMALHQVPAVNASWQETHIQQYSSVQLAFGVAMDDGLLTPVIRDAEKKSLREVSSDAKDLIAKARSKKLTPDAMSGSTFTVTNLGMFDIQNFLGIINPPNGGILSVGATVKKPVVDDNDQIVVGYRMNIGFSGDHRVIDGATGAVFLQKLKTILETPSLMLV